MALPSPPDDISLLEGCYMEALRSDDIWSKLEDVRVAVQETSDPALAMTMAEIRTGARLLRHVGDVAQVHRDRVQFVLNHLNVLLPSLSRSLRDIKSHYDDRCRSLQTRWRDMYAVLTNEAGGKPLPSRFATYNAYVLLLRDILLRSPNFDVAAAEGLRREVFCLREARGLDKPFFAQVSPVMLRHTGVMYDVDCTAHWAENVFKTPLLSKTALTDVGETKSFGPHKRLGKHYIPMNSKILLRQ